MTSPRLKPPARRRENWPSIAEVPILFRLPALDVAETVPPSSDRNSLVEPSLEQPLDHSRQPSAASKLMLAPVVWMRRNAGSIASTVLILAAALAVLIIRDRHRAQPPRPARSIPDASRNARDEPNRSLWPERQVPETARNGTDNSQAATQAGDHDRLATYPRAAVRLSTGPRDEAPRYEPVDSLPTQMPSGVRLMTPTERVPAGVDAAPRPQGMPYRGDGSGAGFTPGNFGTNSYPTHESQQDTSNDESTRPRLY